MNKLSSPESCLECGHVISLLVDGECQHFNGREMAICGHRCKSVQDVDRCVNEKQDSDSGEGGKEHRAIPRTGSAIIPELEVARVKALYTEASNIALQVVERRARSILRQHRNLGEFIMGMGIWVFTDKDGESVDAKYIDNSSLAAFIAEWDEYLKLTGEPMRFTETGDVVRSWGVGGQDTNTSASDGTT